MKIYMKVTADKYQLPIAIADSPQELSAMVGVKPETISQQISRGDRGKMKTGRQLYFKVETEDDDG